MIDPVEEFVKMTGGGEVPVRYRRWVGIMLVAGALGRKVWTFTTEPRPIYPNLYTVLVGEPGSGKTLPLEPAREIMDLVPTVETGPDQITPEKLAETLADLNDSGKKPERDDKDSEPEMPAAELSIFVDEFGSLVRANSKDFLDQITFLSGLYNCPPKFIKETKTQGSDEIYYPCLNICAGTQPSYLATAFSEEAINQGFPARLMLICDDKQERRRPHFGKGAYDPDELARTRDRIASAIEHISVTLSGMMEWSGEAQSQFTEIHLQGGLEPVPQEPLLANYRERRELFLAKLAMIAAAIEAEQTIEKEHLERAIQWQLDAESKMHKALIGAGGNKDRWVEQEIAEWVSQEGRVKESNVRQFMSAHVDAWRQDAIIESLRKQGLVKLSGGFFRRVED